MAPLRKINPPVEYVRRCFEYTPPDGRFVWKYRPDMPNPWNRKHVGKLAGSTDRRSGQLVLRVKYDGVVYRMFAHRVAWAIFYGEWPDHIIDHRDMDPSNNRIGNLRAADHSLNGGNCLGRNAPSGYKGVHAHDNAWAAHIGVNGKSYHLGRFKEPLAAALAYDAAALAVFGEFARTNFHGGEPDKAFARRVDIDGLL